MKKLMIAAAIVCAAAMSQAATVTWKAGTLYKATSDEGGWSTASGDKIKDGSAMGYVFNLTEAQFAALSTGFDQEKVYAAFTAGDSAANSKFTWNFGEGEQTLSAEAQKASTGTGALTLSGTSAFAKGDTAYGLIIYDYTDATHGDMFIANIASYEFGADQDGAVNNLAYKMGGATTVSGASEIGWNAAAVPEPTSGLLLLLGVAGLALRRRRA